MFVRIRVTLAFRSQGSILNDDLAKLLSEDELSMDEMERKRQLERLREEQERQLERLDELANQLAQSQMDAAQRQQASEELIGFVAGGMSWGKRLMYSARLSGLRWGVASLR